MAAFACPPASACPQILLPPSAGASLMSQDAYKNGPMFFRLAAPGGRVTHAGLLEFSGAEGFVALPLKVRRAAPRRAELRPCCDALLRPAGLLVRPPWLR